jgi:serine/threonine-protein kinase RsbW
MPQRRAVDQSPGWPGECPDQPRAGNDGCAVDDLRLRVPALAAQLRPLRRALTEWAHYTPLRPEQVEALRLACDEAAANVVEHAYSGNQTGTLGLDAICRLRRGVVTVTVIDHGQWRPAVIDPRSTRGRALLLIRALTDTMQVSTGPTGATVRMTWTLDQHTAEPAGT